MHRQQLLTALAHYRTLFLEEEAMVERTRRFVLEHEDCFDRKLWPGHVTASAWVVNPARDRVLMLHHKKLDMWLQPGGHADGDPDVLNVVLKETSEETGLAPEHIRLVSDRIFDVDVHVVHESVHDPRHLHFDVRFLVEVDDRIPIPGNDESHEVLWVPLNRVLSFNNLRSIYRMVQKTQRLWRRRRR